LIASGWIANIRGNYRRAPIADLRGNTFIYVTTDAVLEAGAIVRPGWQKSDGAGHPAGVVKT
jgi:hypothetical protein